LSAAYDLRRHGYQVTVFEALPQAGGALTDAIPETRLPNTLVSRDMAMLQQLGITFHLRTAIGQDLPFSALPSRFDAILLTIGTQQSKPLHIPGETLLSGILPARQFLHAVTSGQKIPTGKQVVVIGGDRTAVYAARTALQVGAKKVQLVFEGTRAMMTAPPEELQAAPEEGISLHELVKPRNFIGTEEATLFAVRCDHMALSEPDDQHQRHPERVYGSSILFPADIILVAAGEHPDRSCFPLDLQSTQKDGQQSNEDHLTSVPGLFLAGGVLFGPGTITQAIQHGKQAARVIAAFLQGTTASEVPELPDDGLAIATAPSYLRDSMHKK
jgi:formate dehydrogenase major subunit